MAKINFKGNQVNTTGELPSIGTVAASFKLVDTNLNEVSLSNFSGKRLVLNIFPSIDTGVCAASVRQFNKIAQKLPNVSVLCISMDLPFAHKRFCGAEGIENVFSLSAFRNPEFENAYHVMMKDGPLAGLFSRAVVIINEQGKISYTEQVPEITQEPDYDKAVNSLL